MSKLCYNDVGYDLNYELMKEEHIFKEKEYLVLQKHKNKITEPNEHYKAYRTRAPWCPSGRLIKSNYKDLIDALYEHYFGVNMKEISLYEAIELMTESRKKSGTISFNTAKHYTDDAKKYIPEKLGKRRIVDIEKKHILEFFDRLVGDGSKITKKTVLNLKTVLNKTFDFINLYDGIDVLNVSNIKISDITRKCTLKDNSSEVYERWEIEALNRYLNEHPPTVYSCAIQLMSCLTIRVGELRALKWEDIDYDNKIIHLKHSMVSKECNGKKESATYVDYMKAHSLSGKREIDLSDYALYILGKLKEINGDKEYIFQSNGEKPISTNNINEHLKKYCEAIGIRYRSTHKIRFYACSNLYDNNVDENTIRYYMGHSTIGMTRHYDRRKAKRLSEDKVNSLFGFSIPEGNDPV